MAEFVDHLVAEANRSPIPANSCANAPDPKHCKATVSGDELLASIQDRFLFREPILVIGQLGWIGLAKAIGEAGAGDASALSTRHAKSEEDPLFVGGPAISCLDYPSTANTFDLTKSRQLLGLVTAPHNHGASHTWGVQASCLGWAMPVVNPPHPADVSGAPTILIVNATADPSTGYPWAQSLLSQIEGSVLLTRDGDGHTSYFLPGESKTRDAIDAYLLTGNRPPPNTVYTT